MATDILLIEDDKSLGAVIKDFWKERATWYNGAPPGRKV